MSRQILKTVTRTQGVNAAVTDGTVLPVGFEFGFVDVPVLAQAFRRMVRTLEFDVCEMALTTYLCAREHNIRFTALPIFLVGFPRSGTTLLERMFDAHPDLVTTEERSPIRTH